jgi:signal transduction histidine kinase
VENTAINKNKEQLIISILLVSVLELLNLILLNGSPKIVISNIIQLITSLVASYFTFKTAQKLDKDNDKSKRAWFFIAVASSFWVMGNLVYLFYEIVVRTNPTGSISDIFYFLFYIVFIYALLILPKEKLEEKRKFNFYLEISIIAFAIILVQWNFNYSFLLDQFTSKSNLILFIFTIFTFFDTIILILLFAIILRKKYFNADFFPIIILLTGAFFLIFSDFQQAAIEAQEVFTSGYLADFGWTLAFALIGISAIVKSDEVKIFNRLYQKKNFQRIYYFLSFGFIYFWRGAMYFLLIFTLLNPHENSKIVVIFGASAIIGLVVYREIRASIENYYLSQNLKETLNTLETSNMELKDLNYNLAKEQQNLVIANQQLKNSEHDLQEMMETRSKMLSIISHDIRSPLNALYLSSETLYRYFDKFSTKDLFNSIKSFYLTTQQMSNLVVNLFEWAKSQGSTISFNPESINIVLLVEEIKKIYVENLKIKNIKLIIELQTENNINSVFADKNMSATILRNLISNSIKFSRVNSEIKVNITDYDSDCNYMKIEVVDEGPGLSEEDLDKLFRSDIDRKSIGNSPEKGSGLGLLLCKEFVELHHGKIWAESEINKGTKISFTFPKIKEIFSSTE